MPVIARFYGILVKMYFSDHLPPHFHVVYGEYSGIFEIRTLEMTEGDAGAGRRTGPGMGRSSSRRAGGNVEHAKPAQVARLGVR